MITLAPSSTTPNTYSLNWGAQQSHILEGLRNLVGQDDDLLLTDVTLACDGEYIPAHKLVLSLCSSFFKDLFQKNRADKSNTIVIVSHVNAQNLRYLLQFMYQGRVDIPSKEVDSFLQAGNLLKIEGLIGNVGGGTGGKNESYQQQQQYQQSPEVPSPAAPGSSQPYRSTRTYAPPAPASKKAGISSNSKCDSSVPPSKKSRMSDVAASSAGLPIPVDSTPIVVGSSLSAELNSQPDLPTPTGRYDPLDNPNEYAAGGDIEEGGEEGVDFNNLKTEPIQVYSGYEETNQSELIDEGDDDETYEESGEDSYGLPPANISITTSVPPAVPGPSTSSQSQANRTRGSMPVILDGQFFRILTSDEVGRVKAKCMVCQKWNSKNVLISGRFNPTSNFTTHLKRKHSEEFKAYEELLVSKGRKTPRQNVLAKKAIQKAIPNQQDN